MAVEGIAHGERTAFTLSLAGVRVLLAVVHLIQPGSLPNWIAVGYLVSAGGIAVSVFLPGPWWWILWIAAIVVESIVVFMSHRRYRTLSKRETDEIDKDWTKALDLTRPTDPEYALQGPHLAERFGLFMIILLGEVVASAGAGALGGEHVAWPTLAGAIVLAGALWWIYFESAVVVNERLLVLSGGSPDIASSTFAVGHMFPAFGLLMTAAGLRQLLDGQSGQIAFWLVSVGLGVYLVGARVDGGFGRGWMLRLGVHAVTFPLGTVGPGALAAAVHLGDVRLDRGVRLRRHHRWPRGAGRDATGGQHCDRRLARPTERLGGRARTGSGRPSVRCGRTC